MHIWYIWLKIFMDPLFLQLKKDLSFIDSRDTQQLELLQWNNEKRKNYVNI